MVTITASKMVLNKIIFKDLDNTITITNNEGEIIVRLYVMEDGNLNPDSWVRDIEGIKKFHKNGI